VAAALAVLDNTFLAPTSDAESVRSGICLLSVSDLSPESAAGVPASDRSSEAVCRHPPWPTTALRRPTDPSLDRVNPRRSISPTGQSPLNKTFNSNNIRLIRTSIQGHHMASNRINSHCLRHRTPTAWFRPRSVFKGNR
jgi:hypothetical protein